MGKPTLEYNHTQVVIEKLLKDLNNAKNFVRVASMLFFCAYYVYLICKNILSVLHVIAYSIMFAITILTFIVEKKLKSTKSDSRKGKRIKLEKRRKILRATKIVKYLARSVTVALALYASITNSTSLWDLPLDIASCVVLVGSIILEFVTEYIIKYTDFIKLSVRLDLQNSKIVDTINNIYRFTGHKQPLIPLEEELQNGDPSVYTPQEQAIIDILTKEAEALRKKKEEDKKARQAQQRQIQTDKVAATKAEKQRIREERKQKRRKLTKTEKSAIKNQFETNKGEAKALVQFPEKLDQICDTAEQLINNLPVDIPVLKKIPLFVSLVGNYASGRYTDVSVASVIAIVAALLYFISPVDILPDTLPVVGHIDEAFVVEMVTKAVGNELKKFEEWKNSAHPTDNLPTKK